MHVAFAFVVIVRSKIPKNYKTGLQ